MNLNDISASSPTRGSHRHRLTVRGVTWMHVPQRGFSVWNRLLFCSRPELRCTAGRVPGRFSWSRRSEASPKAKTLASAQISRAQPCFLTLCAQGHPHHVTVRPKETTRERRTRVPSESFWMSGWALLPNSIIQFNLKKKSCFIFFGDIVFFSTFVLHIKV